MKLRILIIDDNAEDRIFAIKEVEKEFELVETVEILSEKELEKALKNFNFDVVITDYKLKWGTGFDVLRRVREVLSHTPVIMLTRNEEIAAKAIKLGFDDCVLKSSIAGLPFAVKYAIEKKKSLMKL